MVNDSTVVVFDEERAVANAGVMLRALLGQRLGIEQLVDETVRLDGRPGGANAGRKVITMVKDQALAHFPSGTFTANAAWTVIAALAHNLLRWTHLLALPDQTIRTARTFRQRLLVVPGRLTRHGRQTWLRMQTRPAQTKRWMGARRTAVGNAKLRGLPV